MTSTFQCHSDDGDAGLMTKHSPPIYGLSVFIWKRHPTMQVHAGGDWRLSLTLSWNRLLDLVVFVTGELALMMNGHLSILYCPTKSYAYHAFITNFCSFFTFTPIWNKTTKTVASCIYFLMGNIVIYESICIEFLF